MDEKLNQSDSSRFSTLVPSDSLMLRHNRETMKTKEWVSGISIILALSIALFLLFNLRSQ